MKKQFFIGILIGGIVFGTISGVVAYNYNAKDMGYEPSDNTWEVNNVESALGSLYTKSKTYQKLDQTTTVTANKLLSGETAYNSNGELITGTFLNKAECVTGQFVCTSCTTAAGQQVLDYIPSTLFFWIGTTSWYYNNVRNDLIVANGGSVTASNSTAKFFVNNKTVFNNFTSGNSGKTFNYIACK